MLDGFYTMGGGHFWEDVFFYQKWRIQRNHISKKCRLLDNWDICRAEGSFDECRQAFIKYIEAFELPRQKGHMIVMLHGLGESKNVFKPLWRAALQEGFMAAAVNYPSTQKGLDGHVRQLDFFLEHLEDVETVSFVTNGIGSIVLKKLFALNRPWMQKFKIGRIVEVNPQNHGSLLLQKISSWPIVGFVLGPTAKEMKPKNIEKIPPLPESIDTGIIFSESYLLKLIEMVTKTVRPPLKVENEQKFEKTNEIISIYSFRANLFDDKKINNAVMSFLLNGKF